jgi:glycine/D-amino acid oxidase-like deaminating enzyme/nitrite reductase/ring-hydroxylating ferredoxin subunit
MWWQDNCRVSKNTHMIQRDGGNTSLWQGSVNEFRTSNKPDTSKLFDVIIAGGGITGVTTALLLQNAGMNCLIVEAKNLCFGTTGGTTAHINTLLDVPYSRIEKNFNKDNAKLFASSLKEAVNTIEGNVRKYNIDCGFKNATATLFAQNAEQADELETISEATTRAGIANSFIEHLSVPLKFVKAMQVPGQARFNAARYVYELAKQFEKAGGVILEKCRVLKADENENVIVETSRGEFNCRFLIYATHIPPGVNLLHFRCVPYRSYAMALTLKDNSYPEDLIYDMYEPYHYYRTQEIDGKRYFIAGGEDHKTAHEDNQERCLLNLEAHVRKHFNVDGILYKWSSQYYESADGLAYIGQLPGHQKIFVGTGYGGNGMPYSHVAALALKRTICGEENPYQDLYDPNRIKPVAGFKEFVNHNVDVVKQFASKFFSGNDMKVLADLATSEGRIVKFNDEKIAIYKDNDGNLHAVSPICTHVGCEVKWNNTELSWDCPCHGARYSCDGRVMTGPATKNLSKVNIRELSEKED